MDSKTIKYKRKTKNKKCTCKNVSVISTSLIIHDGGGGGGDGRGGGKYDRGRRTKSEKSALLLYDRPSLRSYPFERGVAWKTKTVHRVRFHPMNITLYGVKNQKKNKK